MTYRPDDGLSFIRLLDNLFEKRTRASVKSPRKLLTAFQERTLCDHGRLRSGQNKRAELGMFVLREFPTVMEECFQAPVEGAIYAAAIDKLRVEGAIKPWIVDHSALVPHCVGLRKSDQYLRLVFPVRSDGGDPRDRRRFGSRHPAR